MSQHSNHSYCNPKNKQAQALATKKYQAQKYAQLKMDPLNLPCPIITCERHSSKPLRDENALFIHFRDVHLNYRRFKCKACSDGYFKTWEKFREHVIYHHEPVIDVKGIQTKKDQGPIQTKEARAKIKALPDDFFNRYLHDLKESEPENHMDIMKVLTIVKMLERGEAPDNVTIYEKAVPRVYKFYPASN